MARAPLWIVDGYNVLFAWPALRETAQESLEFARDQLTDQLSQWGAYTGREVVLVFDAQHREGPARVEEYPSLQVIFTRREETADTVIEKMAYTLRGSGREVFVTTSDRAEQMMALLYDAARVSARELVEMLQKDLRTLREQQKRDQDHPGKRHLLENHLAPHVRQRFDAMRRGQ